MTHCLEKVAFIGLGVMGYPMAGHLQQKGAEVTVYNRTAAKATAWCAEYSGRSAPTPYEASLGAKVVFLCVGNDNDVREVVYGEKGVLSALEAGDCLVDHTTASASLARELYQACAAKGVHFLDAPVSGGQAGAQNGVLTVMLGGDEATFNRVSPYLSTYARQARLLGPVGAGQLAKMVNQICISGVLQGLAEGMHFAEQAGLDGHAVLEVISKGAAQSWQMENRGHTMLKGQYDFGFAVDWMRKDLAIALSEARHNGASLPLTAMVDQFYAQVQAQNGGRWDTSSLLKVLKR